MKKETQVWECTWNAFHQPGHRFSVIFKERNDNHSLDKVFYDTLKNLGMKIISTSLSIQQNIQDLGYGDTSLSPDAVTDFLKSYKCTSVDKIKLPELPCAIQKTRIGNVQNIQMILNYCCKCEQFEKTLNYLPLLATNDNVLRCFDTDQPVYLTEFCGLFKQSACKFVHTELVQTINFIRKKRFKQFLKDMRLADLAGLLQCEVNTFYSTSEDFMKWNPNDLAIPNKNWIVTLWQYIAQSYRSNVIYVEQSEAGAVEKYLKPLQHWCLLPALINERENILMNVSKAHILIFLETFQHMRALHEALKIGLPKFNTEFVTEFCLSKIAPCLVSVKTPVLLLNCLHYFRCRLRGNRLREEDCYSILRYFADHLKEIQEGASILRAKSTLRSLPVFLTKNGQHVTLDTNSTYVIIPDKMPLQGLDEWSQKTGTILLENSYVLKNLFTFLEITFADAIAFYTQYILENLVSLPDHSVVFHLQYMKDYVLQRDTDGRFTDRQEDLINSLRSLNVIPDNCSRKKASEYFSPHQPVFFEMCRPEDFPPDCFRGMQWKTFLELIGMKYIVTGQMFIQFAKEIATAGQLKITDTSKNKSRIVVQHLLKQQTDIEENELKEISTIKFIVPYLVSSKYSDVHKQYSDAENFICFSKSVSWKHCELSWTSMPLLPEWADPLHYASNPQRYSLRQFLDVYSNPPLDSIISHCQNVCDSLMDKSDGKAKRELFYPWITSFMEKMYETLQSKALSMETAKQRLFYTPVVLFPADVILVQASHVIEEMTSDQEMKPYLLKAPRRFGKYFPLFRYLGATESPSFVHYIKVLSIVKEKVGSSEPIVTEWGVIKKAVDNMFKCLKEESGGTLDEELTLYLPTRGNKVVSTSQIVVVDNEYLERRIGEEQLDKMHIFIGFEALKITGHTINSFQKLPAVIRPKYLSEIVREEVDETAIAFKTNSVLAVRLENFLRSPYFIEGLLRLCIRPKIDGHGVLTDKDRENIIVGLQNTNVQEVTGLNTYLLLNNVRINETEWELNCFMPPPEVKNGVQHNSIYFQKSDDKTDEQWLGSIDITLCKYISQITSFKIREQQYIMKLIHKLNDPRNISLMLDEMKIDAYKLPAEADVSVFPDPGTYVPSEFHHLLRCEFSSFEEHEYRCVALELEDITVGNEDVSDSYKPVYIFVQIRRKMPTNEGGSEFSQPYEVYTGANIDIVPAFRLYKFVRPDSESSKDVVDTVTVPVSECLEKELFTVKHILRAAWNRPEEERRQIIKRLYLRWHPDKNIGNEELCTKVFCYIKEAIVKLERDQLSDDEDSTVGHSQQSYAASSGFWNNRRPRRRSRAYPDFSSSEYFKFCKELNRRCKRHKASAQAYYGSGFTWRAGGGYSTFFGASWPGYKAYHDPEEASRWLRQAKADLSHATRAIDIEGNPAAFNWICYLCHQVFYIEDHPRVVISYEIYETSLRRDA